MRKNLIVNADDLSFNLQRKYIGIICNSIAKYNEIKFVEEIMINIPNVDSKHKI